MTNHEIRALVENDPIRLVRLLERNALQGEEFAVACELGGEKIATNKIQPVFLRQLKRANTAAEWEAVMGGLNYHLDQKAMSVIQQLQDTSPVIAIRQCAADLMEDLEFDEDEPDPDDEEAVHT